MKKYSSTSPNSIFVVLILLIAISLSIGCSASDIPGKNLLSEVSYAPTPDLIKTSFVEGKLLPALESRDAEQLSCFFESAFQRRNFYVEDLLRSVNGVNDFKFEIQKVEIAPENTVSLASDGRVAYNTASIRYRIYGFCGLDYNEFVIQGLFKLKLKTVFGAESPVTSVYEDSFKEYYHARGFVFTEDGKPLEYAALSFKTGVAEEPEYIATTDENGAFHFEFIPIKTISLSIEKPGFIKTVKTIELGEKNNFSTIEKIVLKRDITYGGEGLLTPAQSTTGEAALEDSDNAPALYAQSQNRAVKLTWDMPDDIQGTTGAYNYRIFKKFPSENKFKPAGEISGKTNFTDENLQNGKTHIYKVEAISRSGYPAKSVIGPIIGIPSSFSVSIEFENVLRAGMKFSGMIPEIIKNKKYGGGAYIAFNPEKTRSVSFLTPVKIKSGFYRMLLYIKREKKSAPVKITVKQFGETEDEHFLSKTVDLTAISRSGRDVIDLGSFFMESRNWKNEKLDEDFSDIAITVANTAGNSEKKSGEASGEKEAPSISLDLLELIKID
ncbi:MAG TPA: hypothetical protein PKK26_05130 [Candidatus Wallbacteria bacterium]|nr:hypothetical protein [Candidatus Wallbacteria bacterium]